MLDIYNDTPEQDLLGSVFKAPSQLDRIRLTGAEFANPEYGRLWDLIRDRHYAGEPVDDAALLLRDARPIFGDNTQRILISLVTRNPHGAHAAYYAEQVRELSLHRKLDDIQRTIATRLTTDRASDIVRDAGDALDKLGHTEATEIRTAREAVESCLSEIDNPQGVACSTGIETVDQTLGTLKPGELVILAARPGVGKTALGLQIATHNAEKGRSALFVALEMTEGEMAERLLSMRLAISGRELRTINRKTIEDELDAIDDLPLHIVAPHRATLNRIRSFARLQQRTEAGLDLLVIDYLGLIQSRDRRKSLYEQVSETTADLKRLAKELSVPIVCLCQLNRKADGQAPTLAHLRDSGTIEQDANKVVFLHRVTEGLQLPIFQEYRVIIAKNRNGPMGNCRAWFVSDQTRFTQNV